MRRNQPTHPRKSTALTFIFRRTPHHYDDTGEFAWHTALIETADGRVLAVINGIGDYESALDALYEETDKL